VHGTTPFGPFVAVGPIDRAGIVLVGVVGPVSAVGPIGVVRVGGVVGVGGVVCLVGVVGLVGVGGCVGGGRVGEWGGGVGEGCGDGLVLGQGFGEAEVAACLGGVDAVARGQEAGGVAGAMSWA